MKPVNKFFRNNLPLVVVLTVFFLSVAAISVAQDKNENTVKVKIIKIVDGDTTTIEKTMDEANVQDFTKQFQDVKGKNVQVMISVENQEKDKKEKNNPAQSMHFNFDLDSVTAHLFAKAFVFPDSAFMKNFTWNDSLMKNFPKDFDFKFDFDDEGMMNDFNFDFNIDTDKDGKTVIIKNGKGEKIIINGDDKNVTINKSENDNSKTKTKTIVIEDEKGKGKKKVIVSTSVTVMDMDDKGDDVYRSDKKKDKENIDFSFYPNPSDGTFNLELELNPEGVNGKDNAQVRITDMNGKEVYNENISGNGRVTKVIDLNGKKGTFVVVIKQSKKITSKKIIIE
jgi:hypothetical protein